MVYWPSEVQVLPSAVIGGEEIAGAHHAYPVRGGDDRTGGDVDLWAHLIDHAGARVSAANALGVRVSRNITPAFARVGVGLADHARSNRRRLGDELEGMRTLDALTPGTIDRVGAAADKSTTVAPRRMSPLLQLAATAVCVVTLRAVERAELGRDGLVEGGDLVGVGQPGVGEGGAAGDVGNRRGAAVAIHVVTPDAGAAGFGRSVAALQA